MAERFLKLVPAGICAGLVIAWCLVSIHHVWESPKKAEIPVAYCAPLPGEGSAAYPCRDKLKDAVWPL